MKKLKKVFFNKIIYADNYDEIWIAEIKFNLLDKIGDNDKFSFQYPHNWNIKEKIKVSLSKKGIRDLKIINLKIAYRGTHIIKPFDLKN